MKVLSRAAAIVMIIAILASLMAACGPQKDAMLIDTWKQTDEIDGNCTWTFAEDFSCTLTNDTTGDVSNGTYKLDGNRIRISLSSWEKDIVFTYAVTERVLDMESAEMSYYLKRQ